MKTLRNALGLVFLLTMVLALIIRPPVQQGFTAQSGQSVNNIVVVGANGQAVNLGHLLDHHAALINFWATWCPACRMELPDLDIANTPSTRLILISQGAPNATQQFLMRYQLPKRVSWYDPSGHVFNAFFVTTLPTSYFVNRYGLIVSKVVGPMTPTLLRQNLAEAVSNSKE
ncbi:MAG: TlpA family protein disulfide reductase [Sulfobacillus thermosulfidooxidans]|uniref:TlpA family protein disulfide reductase n=1 Tax=Sulfobacillus sp. hq2 TaxID=2039167 RepID=UPI000CD00979|nr:TlpA disulfide reductase family protein [Sulfobacillus sp. hq2]POB11979.1 hypothetical protein CO251_02440 [Sulfobacillus sp. hq2]PSR37308.1 MAG: TlpA family protein disulfide reductase [Sulfobacillus thermosulfidooxidans]